MHGEAGAGSQNPLRHRRSRYRTSNFFHPVFLLYYYTDVAEINPAIAGSALLVGKLTWDAINDPLIGYLSDRTKSRWDAGGSTCWLA